MILLHERRPELYKAVIEYVKKYIGTVDRQKQKQILPKIISELFLVDEDSKMQNRYVLKHFLLKIMKKYDRDTV